MADPAAHVFDGKIYIYPSHDREGSVSENDNGDHFDMKDYHCLSLMDPDNGLCSDEGMILSIDDIPWGGRQLWDSDIVEKNGTYYLVFCLKDKNDIFRLGVATSQTPVGPFIAQPDPIRGSYSIDPCVFKDDDGEVYCYFGGIWGGQLQNYKDNKLEALADYGNGNCWYIDSVLEARKALVTEGGGAFRTVAWDTKLQVEFNPSYIRGYRLIGYEDRELRAEQFADDTVDGGEVGSGHRVTALYEVVPVDSAYDFGEVTTSYSGPASGSLNGELLKLQIRAKNQSDGESQLSTYVLKDTEEMDQLDDNMKLAAAVAELAMILRDSPYRGSADYGEVLDLLRKCATVTGDVYKEELVYLVGLLQRREQAE